MSEPAVEYRPRTPVVVWLIAGAIALTYAAFLAASPAQRNELDYAFALIPERFDPASPYRYAHWWDALAAAFGHSMLHLAWWHAALNGFFLFVAARAPALRLGNLRFFLLVLASIAGGAFAFVALNWGQQQAAVGASGAVCGVFSAYFLSARVTWVESLRDPRVRNAFMLIFFINVIAMGVAAEVFGIPVAWEGHLGGFVAGALAYVALAPRPRGPWG